MLKQVKSELYKVYSENLIPPYYGSIKDWCEKYIELPTNEYAIPGKLDLSISPYLLKPLEAIADPKIDQINLAMATQIGKTLITEICIPYWIMNAPGPMYRIFHNNDAAKSFSTNRLIPLLKLCEPIKPLISHNRFSLTANEIKLPHMSVIMGGANDGLAHGHSVKYLICDEIHQWEPGFFEKFRARSTYFIGRRKIICSSQPGKAGSEWESIYNKGRIYEWQWLCPQCKTRQPYYWSLEKGNNKYAGFNWDSILNSDGTTNIAESAKTTILECINCDHRVHDTPTERRLLNDTGDYVLIKNSGASDVVSFTCPNFVNIKLSFAYAATKYMLAKQMQRLTGLDEDMESFVTQIRGRFYHREREADLSKILVETYDKENLDKDWLPILTVDVQQTGNVKYWLVRAWNRNGNESKRLDFGIARDWEEIENIRKKYKVPYPLVGIDSGDGNRTQEIYQECIKHGQVITVGGNLQYISWCPLKGDSKVNYTNHPDKIARLYSPISPQDACFPVGHKLRGIPAPLIIWSNYSVKTILANLRDNKIDGVVWKVDRKDEEYDTQLYSEDLKDVIDKKTGLTTQRWIQTRSANHWLDVEAMQLVMAIRASVFSATKINEDAMKNLIENSKPKDK